VRVRVESQSESESEGESERQSESEDEREVEGPRASAALARVWTPGDAEKLFQQASGGGLFAASPGLQAQEKEGAAPAVLRHKVA